MLEHDLPEGSEAARVERARVDGQRRSNEIKESGRNSRKESSESEGVSDQLQAASGKTTQAQQGHPVIRDWASI